METILRSRSREIVISGDRPFVMIGERINPTGRKVLAAEMKAGIMDRVRADAIAQVEAGAQMLDVNAGVPLVDERALLVATIKAVGEVTDVPICIDSSVIEALEAALAAYEGKALLNAAFFPVAMHAGLTCAITNPLVAEVRKAVQASDLLLGHDEYAMNWISAFRAEQKKAVPAG